MLLVQAVEALAASCARDLQGLNTRIHCPQNGETVDLSEGASSVRMVCLCAASHANGDHAPHLHFSQGMIVLSWRMRPSI